MSPLESDNPNPLIDSTPIHTDKHPNRTGVRIKKNPARPRLNPRRSTQRHLRLVGSNHPVHHTPDPGPLLGEPIIGPTDPRWVVALRTADSLQGVVLGPKHREKLVRLGKILGLNPFDTNMIIAIIQDQARRGYSPRFCPTAGEPQLRMVPLPTIRKYNPQPLYTACIISVILLIELLVVHWLLG